MRANKETTKEKTTIIMTLLGKTTAEIKFSDPSQARQMFDILRTVGVFGNISIREIELH